MCTRWLLQAEDSIYFAAGSLTVCLTRQVEIVALPVLAVGSPAVGAHGGVSRAGGVAGAPGSAVGAAARCPAPTAEAAAAPADIIRNRKALYASGMFFPPAKAPWTREIRPAFAVEEIRNDVNTQCKWQWRKLDRTCEDFDKKQCIKIEINWRKWLSLARVLGTRFPVGRNEMLKCIIDLDDMTTSIVGATGRRPCGAGTGMCPWATAGTTRMMMCASSTCRLPRRTTRWWPAPFLTGSGPMAGAAHFALHAHGTQGVASPEPLAAVAF